MFFGSFVFLLKFSAFLCSSLDIKCRFQDNQKVSSQLSNFLSTFPSQKCFQWTLSLYKGIFVTYVCSAYPPYMTKQNEKVLMISGDHLVNRTNAEATKIEMSHYGMVYLPQGISAVFSNILEYDLSKNMFDTVQRNDFQGFEKLIVLNLGGNQLSTLPNDVFQDLKLLECVFLNNNFFESIPHQWFAGHQNLKELYLYHNELIAINGLSSVLFFSIIKTLKSLCCSITSFFKSLLMF
jgi:Leucine rich repeat